MKAMVTNTPPPKIELPLPSPTRRPGRRPPGRPQRLAFALMLVLFAAAGAAAVWSFVRPSPDPWVSVGLIENFPPGTVTSFLAVLDVDGRDGFHIVRLDDGELLALRDRDTHLGDPVPYRPDFVYAGRTGWFRGVHAETYDMAGRQVFGPTPRDLDRLAVEVRNGAVYVNPRAITPGRSAIIPGTNRIAPVQISTTPGGDDFQTEACSCPRAATSRVLKTASRGLGVARGWLEAASGFVIAAS